MIFDVMAGGKAGAAAGAATMAAWLMLWVGLPLMARRGTRADVI
jgi:hypothetical protein